MGKGPARNTKRLHPVPVDCPACGCGWDILASLDDWGDEGCVHNCPDCKVPLHLPSFVAMEEV